MSTVVVVALCLLAVPLQMQLAHLAAIGGIQPDLPSAAVYGISLVLGPWVGGGVGGVVGLLIDRFSGGLIGPQLMSHAVIGMVGGMLGQRLLQASVLTHGGVSWVLFFLQGCWMTGLIWWQMGEGWRALYLTALPEACYTASIVMLGIRLIWLWPTAERHERIRVATGR